MSSTNKHIAKIDKRIADIKTQMVGVTGANVLVVEGVDDIAAFRILLDRSCPGWEQNWHIVEVQGKSFVLGVLAKEQSWIGVVDRDEWTDSEITTHASTYTNLFVLPRFCMESYLIDPNEIWEALPEKQRQKLANGFTTLESAISQNKANWLRHAALWHVVNPLWRHMMDLGFNNVVLDPQYIPDDTKLLETFEAWGRVIDAQTTLTSVNRTLANIQTKPEPEQFSRWIYAKDFYPQIVHQALDKLLGQRSEKNRRADLFRHIPLPTDLEPLWQKMGLVTQ